MFEIIRKIDQKRIGRLKTQRRVIQTPFFMPDATKGFLRSTSKEDLQRIGLGPMVVNTYHLFLQPGMTHIQNAGGIHNFMNWPFPLLSDSGGYQVFSLVHKNSKMGKVTENEVVFRSPIDGSMHTITPEKSIQIQFDLGVDMMVCFDDPSPNHYPKEKIALAVERTLRWAKRCKQEYEKQLIKRQIKESKRPLLFGVIQGGNYRELRKRCTDGLIEIGFDGYGFGARHLDENGEFLSDILEYTASLIPPEALRFALGVGTPQDIIRCFSYGWDMFDCVIPTREGRHGRLFIWKNSDPLNLDYEIIQIGNERFKDDFSPVDPHCQCELCQNHTRSYLRYMFQMKEPLAMRLATLHNLNFYLQLMQKLRESK